CAPRWGGCPVASGRAWRSRARCSASRASSCSTSRWPRSASCRPPRCSRTSTGCARSAWRCWSSGTTSTTCPPSPTASRCCGTDATTAPSTARRRATTRSSGRSRAPGGSDTGPSSAVRGRSARVSAGPWGCARVRKDTPRHPVEHMCDVGRPTYHVRVSDSLLVRGAREHNLMNVGLELPRDRLIVFTGLSGSGKSSLAFDTIIAEGQRRYAEALSSYARQFLGQMDKPDVDFIEGLSPAVSIDQKSTNRNPRSTVGTITEVYDYLRLLFARAGIQHCPVCGERVTAQTPQQIVDRIRELPEGTRFQVLAPVVRGRKGEYSELFRELQSRGFARARVDGEVVQ